MAVCEWAGCGREATHILCVAVPGSPEEVRFVCREHDRALKNLVVRSRPKASRQKAPDDAPPKVTCGGCGNQLQEDVSLTPEQRQPCPVCGSLNRVVAVSLAAEIRAASSLRLKVKRKGSTKWSVTARVGDDYTRDLDAWSRRELRIDREQNLYMEIIELYDGTKLRSISKLTDHKD